ncbi:MAG: beta-lactamase family protein [Sedimentisphaerales bacterium]|nr:beta-lactamase family protein [Sedimentisphaerales bacterium]
MKAKKLIIRFIFVVVILLVTFVCGCNSVSPKLQDEYIRPDLSQGMRNVFDKYRQSIPKIMVEDKVPGLSLALIDRDGLLWAAGFGYTNHNRKTPVTTDTMFALCSISKTITAVAVMIAVQEGLLELDIPIIEYWPEFTVNSRFEENPDQKITLRHLLSHTSGITHEAPVGNAREPSYGSFEDHVLSVSDTWLRHKVGERFSYSGFGYDLIAYILQMRSGQPFSDYVEEKVFIPLNMSNCSVDPEFIRNHPNRAVGHKRYVKQVPLPMDVPWVGAGSVYASAEGLAKFVQFFLNKGKVDTLIVLDDSLISSMYPPSICSKDYGLGVHAYYINGRYSLGHMGGGVGFVSGMFWLPEYKIGCVFLSNSEELAQSIDLFSDLIKENLVQKNESFEIPSGEYHVWQPPDPNTSTSFKPAWNQYVGTYQYIMSGWKFDAVLNIVLALGLTANNLHVKVFEENGYLYVDSIVFYDDDGGRLDEYLPGLFFTPSGKCLDLRGPDLTWQNYRIKKVDNDTNRDFDIN